MDERSFNGKNLPMIEGQKKKTKKKNHKLVKLLCGMCIQSFQLEINNKTNKPKTKTRKNKENSQQHSRVMIKSLWKFMCFQFRGHLDHST